MQGDKIRIGLFSFAHFHQHHWAKVFLNDPRVEAAGVWDSDGERLSAAAEQYGIPPYKQEKALLEKCDAAAVCSDTGDHLRLLGLCYRAKKAVLCEKPSGVSLAQSRKMKKLVDASGTLYYQSFPQRHIPSNLKIKEMIDAGVLGRITHVRKRHGHYFGFFGLEKQMPWIVDPEKSGGGAFLDEGIHETDVLRWFFGDPVSVHADLSFTGPYPVETSGAAVYRYPNELLCVLECGWNWHAGGPTTEIYGEKGVLIQNGTDCASNSGGGLCPDLNWYDVKKKEWIRIDMPWDFSKIHTYAPKDFIDVLTRGHPPASGLDDGIKAAEMIEGAYRSCRKGKTVFFPITE
jgi:predicted dehydrogenase